MSGIDEALENSLAYTIRAKQDDNADLRETVATLEKEVLRLTALVIELSAYTGLDDIVRKHEFPVFEYQSKKE